MIIESEDKLIDPVKVHCIYYYNLLSLIHNDTYHTSPSNKSHYMSFYTLECVKRANQANYFFFCFLFFVLILVFTGPLIFSFLFLLIVC